MEKSVYIFDSDKKLCIEGVNMKGKVLIAGLMLLLLSSLSGCGGSGGSSGSTNSNETGVLIQSINISPTSEDGPNIDVFSKR